MPKRRKKEVKQRSKYFKELVGLLIIVLSIVGLGEFGPIGSVLKNVAIILSGSFAKFFFLFLIFVSLYMVITSKTFKFFSARLVGIYLLVISFLSYLHLDLVRGGEDFLVLFKQTIEMNNEVVISGGGFLGLIFSYGFNFLIAEGTLILLILFVILGILMLFNITLGDIFRFVISLFKRKKNKITTFDSEKIDKRIVISSIDDLKKIDNENIKEKEMSFNREETKHDYKLPPLSILDNPKRQTNTNQEQVKANIEVLERVFKDFDISAKIVEVHVGPSVTQYEIELKAGTKVSKIVSLDRELSLALAAKSVKIQAPIPGKSTIGIEIPNKENTPVVLKDVLIKMPTLYDKSKLAIGLGKDIMGNSIYAEINKTPHLLIAGATGSGKSVCINTIITSILMRVRPDEVKMILIDPKKVELSVYNGIPHLLSPVVSDPKKASLALIKVVQEMERRYDVFTDKETKNIETYNQYVENKNKGLLDTEKLEKMPYILVVIDELADLMLVAAKEVEDSVMRITQMARASGIHLIVATQRPSTDVITGIIKANIPSRLSFAVSSNVDSRTILDQGGAEKLLGKGDMLFLPMGENIPIRLQGCFISDDEVKRVVEFTIKQQKAKYDDKMIVNDESKTADYGGNSDLEDPLYESVLEFAIEQGEISASKIQRRFKVGFNRAATIMDMFEERGIVGQNKGSKPREVLVKINDREE